MSSRKHGLGRDACPKDVEVEASHGARQGKPRGGVGRGGAGGAGREGRDAHIR